MKKSQSFRMLAISGLCTATLLCAACNKNEPAAAPPTVPDSSVTTAPTDPKAAAAKAAQAKLDEIAQYIQDGNFDTADKVLTDLEQNKYRLPPDFRSQLQPLRKALIISKANYTPKPG